MSDYIHELDAQGLQCPMPLLKAKQILNRIAIGEQLRVLATDAGSVRDFKAYTDLTDHRLISSQQELGVYIYLIERG